MNRSSFCCDTRFCSDFCASSPLYLVRPFYFKQSAPHEMSSTSLDSYLQLPAKRARTESAGSDAAQITSFDSFTFVRVLRVDPSNKSIFLHCRCPAPTSRADVDVDGGGGGSQLPVVAASSGQADDDADDATRRTLPYGADDDDDEAALEDAVVILEKLPFSEPESKRLFESKSRFSLSFRNDIYSSYLGSFSLGADVKATVICPATEKHFQKYSKQAYVLVEETPEQYARVTAPHIEANRMSMQWVYNILDHIREADRIVFEDTSTDLGFILLPDLKWDMRQVENLHMSAIVHRRDIGSIRDLRAEHLALLSNILEKSRQAISDRFSVAPNQIRAYFHYPPTYYHLHLHVTHVMHRNAPGSGVERAHLLTDVIKNLRANGDYYRERTISVMLSESSPLLKGFRDTG